MAYIISVNRNLLWRCFCQIVLPGPVLIAPLEHPVYRNAVYSCGSQLHRSFLEISGGSDGARNYGSWILFYKQEAPQEPGIMAYIISVNRNLLWRCFCQIVLPGPVLIAPLEHPVYRNAVYSCGSQLHRSSLGISGDSDGAGNFGSWILFYKQEAQLEPGIMEYIISVKKNLLWIYNSDVLIAYQIQYFA